MTSKSLSTILPQIVHACAADPGLVTFKYLSDSTEPYDARPVTGLSPPVVKRKNAALCFNRLNTAPGKLERLVNYKDIL